MTEKGKDFVEFLSNNPELADKLNAGAGEGADEVQLVVDFAKEHGYEVCAEDFAPATGELSEDELLSVAGGGTCVCSMVGGGTKTEEWGGRVVSTACACVLGGAGLNNNGEARCGCPICGFGNTYHAI